MSGHNFAGAQWTPDQATHNAVPGLSAVCGTPMASIPCSNGCGYNLIPSHSIWVDYGRKLLQKDTAKVHCDRNPRGGAAAASAAGGAVQVQQRVPHTRPDLGQAASKMKMSAPYAVRPDVTSCDERAMAKVKEEIRQRIIMAPQMTPPNLRQLERRITRQLMDVVIAMAAGMCVEAASSTTNIKDAHIRWSYIIRGATGFISASDFAQNLLVYLLTLRGWIERIDHLSFVQSTVYKELKDMEFLATMRTAMGQEVAEIRECCEKLERFGAPAVLTHLEGTPSFTLGVAVASRDESAMRAFFRAELPREEAAAKKVGWRPPAPGAGAAAGAAGGGGGGGGSSAAAAAGKGGGGKPTKSGYRPKKKVRKIKSGAATVSAGGGRRQKRGRGNPGKGGAKSGASSGSGSDS